MVELGRFCQPAPPGAHDTVVAGGLLVVCRRSGGHARPQPAVSTRRVLGPDSDSSAASHHSARIGRGRPGRAVTQAPPPGRGSSAQRLRAAGEFERHRVRRAAGVSGESYCLTSFNYQYRYACCMTHCQCPPRAADRRVAGSLAHRRRRRHGPHSTASGRRRNRRGVPAERRHSTARLG